VADYLILLSHGEVRLASEVDDLLARHRVLTGPTAGADVRAPDLEVIDAKRAAAQAHVLVRVTGPDAAVVSAPPGFEAHPVTLEEVVLAYLRAPGAADRAVPVLVPPAEPTEVAR
jgi:ABC-2 type transport system ATP-binding protein